ncbi:MAG: hypothetical protein JWQ38_3092 [Flavipsychrobacter sp.]|nr:hypothetical protein [Flavipsychrobacter sp.]
MTCVVYAQDKAQQSKINSYFINTDLVYDIESIPTVGYEHFFMRKDKMNSWRVDVGYQIHYSDSFGVVQSHGDRISIGVYQGPVAKFGYSIYSNRQRRKWRNYFSPALGVKYLWYDKEYVHTGKRFRESSFRIQSEQCLVAIPQFTIGSKHTNKHFCADFYVGLQLPIKSRAITVYQEQDNLGHESLQVPYEKNTMTVTLAPVLGIKLGYIK